MKNNIRKIGASLLAGVMVASLNACGTESGPSSDNVSSKESSNQSVSSSVALNSSAESTLLNNPVSGGTQYVYTEFLMNLYENDDTNDTLEFSYKDLNDDGNSELVLARNGVDITIYTFDGGLIEVGNYNFMTGTTRLLFSENSAYPGMFYFFESGGLDHYGYITVKDNKLIDEKLWNEDYSGTLTELGISRNIIEELSANKQLINESKVVYEKNNDIEFSLLS